MVEKENVSAGDSAVCSACEMAVVWVQNQLKQKQTKEEVLSYINEVTPLKFLLLSESHIHVFLVLSII